jgi:hypothetical protein
MWRPLAQRRVHACIAGAKVGSSGGSNSRRAFLLNLSQFQRFLHDCKCEKLIGDGKAAVIFSQVGSVRSSAPDG